jgi:hypothetical protein
VTVCTVRVTTITYVDNYKNKFNMYSGVQSTHYAAYLGVPAALNGT